MTFPLICLRAFLLIHIPNSQKQNVLELAKLICSGRHLFWEYWLTFSFEHWVGKLLHHNDLINGFQGDSLKKFWLPSHSRLCLIWEIEYAIGETSWGALFKLRTSGLWNSKLLIFKSHIQSFYFSRPNSMDLRKI